MNDELIELCKQYYAGLIDEDEFTKKVWYVIDERMRSL